MVDILYMRHSHQEGESFFKFFNITNLSDVWDNSFFMSGFDNISNFVNNEINLLNINKNGWPDAPYVMILDGDNLVDMLNYLKNEKRLISDLQNNNCRVIVNIREGGVNDEGYTYYEFEEQGDLDTIMQKNKINKNNLIWMTPEYLIDSKQQKDFSFIQKFFNKWELQLDSIKQEYYHPHMLNIFKNGRNFSRLKHFYSVSSSPRSHRLDLIEFLRDNDLLKCGNATFFSNAHGEIENNEYKILGGRDLKFDSKYYWEGRDKTGDWSYLPTYAINVVQCFNSYFHVLSGSIFEIDEGSKFPYVYFNEKLWKPMMTLQPFIFIGQPNTLSSMKEFGFKSFHPFINESYDKELNSEKRKLLIYGEIKRLCSMSIEDMDKWFWGMEDILIHNYNRLTEYGYEHYDEYIALIKEKI
tara:strand:+ start:607 stop:1842 length:1236 start_codon:yes stop_codon:yes gene_type:complete